jgi:hypothetical protein
LIVCGTAAVVVVQPGTALPTELPEHECSGRDSNPRPVDYESITGTVPARSREVRRGHEVRSGRGVEPQRRTIVQPLSPDNRAASARDDLSLGEAGPPGLEPGPTRLELVVLPLHHGPVQSGRPGSNGSPRSGAPVLFRLSYARQVVRPAGVEPAASAVAGQRSLR